MQIHRIISRWMKRPWPPGYYVPGCYCCGGDDLGYFWGGASGPIFTAVNDNKILLYKSNDVFVDKGTFIAPNRTGQYGAALPDYLLFPAGLLFADNDRYQISTATQTSRTDVPSPSRTNGGVGMGTDSVYLFGGTSASPIFDNDQYDNVANSWTAKTDMPTPGAVAPGFAVNGNSIYRIGGFASGSYAVDLDAYSISGNSWTAGTDMPAPARSNCACVLLGSDVYVTGGSIAAAPQKCSDVDSYAGGAWTSRADMPLPVRSAHAGFAASGAGWFGGDGTRMDEFVAPSTWTSKTAMPQERVGHSGGTG